VLLFNPNSSRQAEQKKFQPETFSCSLGNSLTLLLGSIPLRSETQFPRDLRLPTGGGLLFTFRFLAISAVVGDLSLSKTDDVALDCSLSELVSSESKLIKLLLVNDHWLLVLGPGPESGAAIFFYHAHANNNSRILFVYSGIMFP
jgi:hypothetical protein